MGWVTFIYYVIVLIISIALSPKPPKPKPAALEDFEVPVAEEDRPIPVIFGKNYITGPNVTWYGDLGSTKIKKSGLFGSTTIGFKYYLGLDFKLCHGPVNSLTQITIGDKLAWSGTITENGSGSINQPKLFGGEKKEGGVFGDFNVMFGEDDQEPDPYLAGVTTQNPAYRGIFGVVWTRAVGRQSMQTVRGILTSKLMPQGYIGNTPYLKPWAFTVTRLDKGWDGSVFYPEKLNINDGMNPAHMIYECITNREWGMGDSAASIDTASFMEVADKLFDEGFGLRMLWNRSTTIADFIEIILNHVAGALNFNRTTGKYMLQLFRNDYDTDDLPEFDEDNIKSVTSFQRQLWGETCNEIAVSYTDPDTFKASIVTAQDLANIQAQSARISQKLSYPGIFDRDLAAKIAIRELAMRSTPLAKLSFIANRTAWPLKKGDVIKVSWARLGLAGVIFRVLNVPSGGTLKDGAMNIECIEDIFGLPSSSYTVPGEPEDPIVPLDPPEDLNVDNSNGVISTGMTSPPADPSDGDRYLVPTGATDEWVGLEGTVVEWDEDEGLWIPVEVPPGQIIFDETAGQHVGTDDDGQPIDPAWTPAIPPLLEDTTPDFDADFLVMYDPVAQSYKKVLGDKWSPAIPSLTEETSPAVDDMLLMYDVSTSSYKKVAVETILASLPETILTLDDETATLVNSRMLVEGSNITFDASVPGELTIHAAGGGGGGFFTTVYATSDQSKSNDTSLANDADLVATLSANKQYRLEFDVFWDTSATPDLKFDLNFTGTTTSVLWTVDNRSGPTANLATISTSGTIQSFACSALNVVFAFNVSSNTTLWEKIVVFIEVGASGGVFSLRWAQNTTSGTAITRRRNSTLQVTEY